jgi:hypothetical protein
MSRAETLPLTFSSIRFNISHNLRRDKVAKGCVYYDIQVCNSDAGWKSLLKKPFRDTPEGAESRYDDVVAAHPDDNDSIRLIEARVLKQRNGARK